MHKLDDVYISACPVRWLDYVGGQQRESAMSTRTHTAHASYRRSSHCLASPWQSLSAGRNFTKATGRVDRRSRDAKMALNGAILLLVVVVGVLGARRERSPGDEDSSYLNQWAVHIPGGRHLAQRVARELGYVNYGQVSKWTAFCKLRKTQQLMQHYSSFHILNTAWHDIILLFDK